jgi:hypothetical protein
MKPSFSKEDLEAFNELLGAAYATLDEASSSVDSAHDDVQAARDEARALYGTSEATSSFNSPLADIKLAARAIADAIAGLPPLEEVNVEQE